MPPKSPGRTPKWTTQQIRQSWKDWKAQNPTGSKTAFAKDVLGMSYSRVKAILNNHPSEQKRKSKSSPSEQTAPKEVKEEKKVKSSGLQFYALNSWDDWS